MDQGTVRIVREKVISLPPNLNLPDFDETIRWMDQGYHSAAQQENRQRFVQLADDRISSRCALRYPLPRELPKSAR